MPIKAAHRREGLQAAGPAVEGDQARVKATLPGGGEHGAKVLVLGHTSHRFVVEPIVAGDGVCAITPQQGDQVDATDHAMMFARPVAMHQLDLLGIRLVQRGVVEDQELIVQDDVLAGLSPERGGSGARRWSRRVSASWAAR